VGWRILHNEKLYGRYSSVTVILVIKYRKMRWGGGVARIGDSRGVFRVLVGKPEKNNQLKDLYMDASIILKRIFIWDFEHALDSSGTR
jgi:hypothetical protein